MPTTRCPSAEQLERLLDEQLDDDSQRSVSQHVNGCALCQAALEQLTDPPEDEPASRSMRLLHAPAAADSAHDPFLARLKQSPPASVSGSGAPPGAAAAAASNAAPMVPGYEILEVLGRGGMGVVYKARQLGLNRLVALKMILSGGHAGPKGLARFLAEAEAVAGLRHPHIVQIYDIGEASGSPYFALEFVEGGSLARRLRGDPQPVEPAVRLLETLARAMHFAHEQGIVHRDLKPSNILLVGLDLSVRGLREPINQDLPLIPKITDFGLAKRLGERSSGTQTGEVVGTPSYMAPEQAAGKAALLGPATDVWALGAILYELLTGRPPFKGATPLDTVVQVLHEEPVPPGRLRKGLPRDLEIICLKCLQKDPRARYATAEELADDLRRFRQDKPIAARPVSRAERAAKWVRRHPLTAALMVAIVVVTALGFLGMTSQWRAAEGARAVAVAERKKARNALYFSRIAQGQLQWRVNDVAGYRRSLEKCLPTPDQEDRRGWEWYYLGGLFHTDLFTLRHGRAGASGAVAYRPDGRWIASVVGGHPAGDGAAGEVRLWDAVTGHLVKALAAPGTAHRLAFAPDGGRIALAGTDGSVLVWDPAAARELLRRTHHTQTAADVAFSPDGVCVASAGWDGLVKIWDARTGKVRHTLAGHAGRVQGVAYHPDGGRVVSAGWDTTVKVWDARTGKEARTLRGHLSPVYAVAFAPDGRLLASAGSNGNLKIWDVTTWRVVQSLTGHTGAVLGLAFSPDGRYLAYGGGDATVRVWDVENGVERFIFRGHTGPVESVHFSPDGRRLVSSSPAEAAARVWDLTRHPEFGTFARTRGLGQGVVKIRELTRRPEAATPAQTGPDIEALAFDPQGRRLVSVTVGGMLQTWDAATGVLLHQGAVAMSEELVSPAVLADFSPGGAYLAARARDDERVVKVWDAATGAEAAILRGHTLPVFCVRFSADGRKVVTCGCRVNDPAGPHEVKVWDAPGGKLLANLAGHGHLFNAALSPDGRWLALARHDGKVTVVDWQRPRRRVEIGGHKGPVSAVAFAPAPLDAMLRGAAGGPEEGSKKGAPVSPGWLLASAGLEDRTVLLWGLRGLSAAPRKEPRHMQALAAPAFLCDLAFSPVAADGSAGWARWRLAGVSRDEVKMWDLPTGHEVLTLRGARQRHWDPPFNPRVLFSPDGKRLAATNWDETISVWEAEMPGDDTAVARHQAARRRAAEARGPLWHLQEAEDGMDHHNRLAAQFHLRRLGDVELPAPLQARKERLLRQLDGPEKKGG